MIQDMNDTFRKALRAVSVAAMALLTSATATAGVEVRGNVYGGGNNADVKGNVVVNIKGGTVVNDVYGGGALASTNTNNWQSDKLVYKYVDITSELTETSLVDEYYTKSDDKYTPATGTAQTNVTYYKRTTEYTTTVNLTGGSIGDAYGGGLGRIAVEANTEQNIAAVEGVEAKVYGDVTVILNEDATDDCIVNGSIFGCNNLNGSPQSSVTVHVYGTKGAVDKPTKMTRNVFFDATEAEKEAHSYDLKAVYGGGNKAAYYPVNSLLANNSTNANDIAKAHTNVIIEGCDRSSIRQVYGGGNAASTPGTEVTIRGAYEIEEVFGGGNGKPSDEVPDNNGANVGYKADTDTEGTPGDSYGSGKAKVNIHGGTIHSIYGGSNTKGNVREAAIAMLEKEEESSGNLCALWVDEAYGGGKSAPMNGRAELQLGCIPGVGRVYGGARSANVNNDVNLRIINGKYDKVYGGNNESGRILGSITVEIEEVGCENIEIGELFGGGNNADYYVTDIPNDANHSSLEFSDATQTNYYKNFPKVNVLSATKIGKVFGGGDNAEVTGNPHVKIDMVQGQLTGKTVKEPLGTIAQVFGGGNNAGVNGSTYVDVIKGQIKKIVTTAADPSQNIAEVAIMPGVYGGCNTSGTIKTVTETVSGETVTYGGDTHVNIVGANANDLIIGETGALAEVCGGGLGEQTEVKNNAYVKIGSEGTTSGTYSGKASILGDIYGGSAFGKVNNTEVDLYSLGTSNSPFSGNVYGGGKGSYTESSTTGNIAAQVKGTAKVNMIAATVTGGIYGGCNINGTTKAAEVNMLGGTLGVEGTPKADLLFAGGKGQKTTTTDATMNIGSTSSGSATIYSNVYGGSALGAVGVSVSNEVIGSATVNLYHATAITGDVFGDGMGDVATNAKARMGNSTVYLYSLDLSNRNSNIYGGCNYNGTVYGKATVNLIGGSVAEVYGGGQGQLTQVANSGSVEVNVGTAAGSGSTTVTGDIYGGSAFGGVNSSTVNIYSATSLGGNVFGGGKGQLAAGNQAAITATVTGKTTVNMMGATVPKAIYGGCNENGTSVDAEINVTGGTVGSATKTDGVLYGVFGGGYGSSTAVNGNVEVNIGKATTTGTEPNTTTTISGNANVYGDVYGGSAQGTVNKDEDATTKTTTTKVHLYAGKVNGNVFGGGLGVKPTGSASGISADVYGDVLVDLNNHNGTCAVTGNIFGCNDTYGSPEGHVTVHVYKTVPVQGSTALYDLAAVYGGGNEADYEPKDSKLSTEVIIENCDATSIENVYGGGNAAASPATEVWILGSKIIKNVFGGGNGEQGAAFAANVGFKSDGSAYTSGSGKAQTKLVAGNVTTVYGGSNSNGDIRVGTWITMPQKSDYTSSHPDVPAPMCCENLLTDQIYGGGKNADMSGGTNVVLGCQPNRQIDEIYAGAQNANIKGDVSLTITSGRFGRVFGGNKDGGALMGAITVNIEESGETCGVPIVIGELYGGGNLADYSIYGYKEIADPDNASGTIVVARSSLSDNEGAISIIGEPAEGRKYSSTQWYADPKLNVRSFTSIGKIFGAGYKALMAANPTVDINVVRGSHYDREYSDGTMTVTVPATATDPEETLTLPYPKHKRGDIGAIGSVFGGGNLAKVIGSATVNIGTESSVTFITEPTHLGTKGTDYTENSDQTFTATVEGAYITGNVYGGGSLADITGNTQVNICAKKSGDDYLPVPEGTSKVIIGGNVFGGGMGVAKEEYDADAFFCAEAMVGENNTNSIDNNDNPAYADYGTHVRIGNGTVNGSVYGGGEIGRVEFHTEVVIGLGGGTKDAAKSPVITGSVFGAGKGNNTHGYSGLVRGDSRVTVQGDAKVGHSVYGGGEMASVGKYQLDANGLPKTPVFGGKCTVSIGGYAEIGPDGMKMDNSATTGKPDDTGHVFGAGKGTLPYENVTGTPWSMENSGKVIYGAGKESDYYKFIQSLGLASNTEVTIREHAFVKGSVYGGSENGYLQANTHVTIAGGQIGEGLGQTAPYADAAFIDPSNPETPVTTSNALAACATWTYDKATTGKPYDKYATYLKDGEYYYDAGFTESSKGGAPVATDGHTYYGNVFGGGRGVVPFAAGKWHRAAGSVAGTTQVDITGGHILSSVYGGNENTDVGSYAMGTNGEPTTTLNSGGTCTINMSGGTVGVPRTKEQIENNPVIGNVFGAGKGDKRVLFNTWTNVGTTSVNISGTAKIYGSVFGGGEDGHVINNAVTSIGGTVIIGSTGISGADGNVFGGGRGSETALTAGVVGGNVTLTINNGKILGSVYGGGRLASVGTNFVNPDITSLYGKMQSGDDHGHVTVNINGGFIGTSTATGVNGNIFGAGKGTANNFDLGIVKSTKITMTNGTAYASVYGGGELAQVVESHTTDGQVLGTEIAISGGTIGIEGKGGEIWGNVFAGGKGNITHVEAGLVKSNTKVTISQADDDKPTTIYHNIYGGGAYGSVGTFTYANASVPSMPVSCASGTGSATVAITGGTIGVDGDENGMVFGSSRGDVGAPGEIHDYLAWVYDAHVTIGTSGATTGPQINGSVYGSGENGHTYHDAEVIMHSGTVGITEGKPIGSYTAGGASYPYRGNVYGGGCGTDKYDSDNDGTDDSFNPLAGIVLGDASVTMDGGTVVHNIYGAGAMGSVGTTTTDDKNHLVISSGGTTTIAISGGTVGVSGTVEDGNVFGAARGDVNAPIGLAQVKTTEVTISQAEGKTTRIYGNVYGGGALGDVGTYYTVTEDGNDKGNNVYLGGETSGVCTVLVTGGTIGSANNTTAGHVFGAGKGDASTYTCQKAMVKETSVTVSNGTIYGDVYGGGEVGRVEHDAEVMIGSGTGDGPFAPVIHGNVFGAGAGLETHGYSALVRGNSTVTIEGKAAVRKNVYGGGKAATVGKYWVSKFSPDPNEAPPAGFPDGMPYKTRDGGLCTVTIQGNATIGPENGDVTETDGQVFEGQVFGAGKGVNPRTYTFTGDDKPSRMNSGGMEPLNNQEAYFQFLETLALASNTVVTIGENATVKASVFGGSESGFVQDHTSVTINDKVVIGTETTTTFGNVFGGGKGLEAFAEAGRVRGNTLVAFNGGTAYGSVYGGGKLGDVGTIDKTDINNFTWAGYDDTDPTNDTGKCTVSVTNAAATVKGNVFGAGKGSGVTFQCEKAMAYNTEVTISDGTVNGNIYGGGEVGRVENDTQVTIGRKTGETEGNGTGKPDIKGSVYGAGKGLVTHGYSALVRGNTEVTVEGASGAKVGVSVYGGGEIASVGRYGLNAQKMPNILLGGGKCIVRVLGNVVIGPENASDDKGNVFGAGKGVDTPYDNTNKPQRMTLDGSGKSVYETIAEDDYATYLETLALVTHPEVTIDGHAIVNGSVFGGGELGLTKGSIIVNINNGTIEKDVYGGGALANTNTTHEVGVEENGGWKKENGEYVTTTVHPTTTVNLIGGLINGDAYGGGLGDLAARGGTHKDIAAMVYGDVFVTLGNATEDVTAATATTFRTTYVQDDKGASVVSSGRIFGCNNLNGSPKGNVTVTVNRTVKGKNAAGEDLVRTVLTRDAQNKVIDAATPHVYEVAAVYGGGNLANYEPDEGKKPMVRLNTCDISIEEVYGGGNAAMVPETDVLILGAHEIENVFGGGNGEDKYTLNGTDWITNPGANVGTEEKSGNTNTLIKGGYIHAAYGASNSKGTIHGNVMIDTGTTEAAQAACPVQVEKLVAAGKDADVNGDLKVILGCKDAIKIPLVYGGADNANVNGDVELTITSGHFGQVFGGNNLGGAIRGHIILNIEETSDCEPIRIDELYLGGNMASYSKFGYYIKTTTSEGENATGKGAPDEEAVLTASGKLWFMPRKSKDDPHYPVKTYDQEEKSWTVITDKNDYPEYDDPIMNLISCTEATEVFGGGYGDGGDMYANPTVNINMIPGSHAEDQLGGAHKLGKIVDVYGGGNLASVVGDATINIGTAKTVTVKSMNYDETTKVYTEGTATVEGAYITGNVYGGGKLANVGNYDVINDIVEATGNTFVNIGAVQDATDATKYVAVAEGMSKVVVAGNVFGGGKGSNATFKCEKAMVTGGTNINIGNGTVNGTVYGGGEVGRVENDTKVTIGLEQVEGETTSAPVIEGFVFGAGKGDNTHGYSALVRGDTYVTIQGNAKVGLSIYGGGEIASVGRYKVADAAYNAEHPEVEVGMPYSTDEGGVCTVVVQGNAEIGPDDMKMVTDTGWPIDRGHVFGAGKGVLPYEGVGPEGPKRMIPDGTWESYVGKDAEYLKYIETLALTTTTDVTISGNAFVKGSVYGGSENGHVQKNTHVTIDGDCQIGNGDGVNRRYTATEWASESLAECASWPYKAPYAPYDVYDYQEGTTKPKAASDGHTYFGNVFGGGSGIFPYSRDPNYNEAKKALGYSDGLWLRSAGMVYGSTVVDIKGGHVLTSVYGGNECTDVNGTTTVNMSGGTIGVPRTVDEIKAHPVTCYLFGAGKGDQRINFNTWTNVEKAIVNITGGRIFGSVFGGGEDGHVLGDVEMTISGESTLIGTTGTSFVDGNIFGGGRGFSGEAQTAGTVGGNIGMTISGGNILGSVYGGGRLASVGTEFTSAESPNYGNFKEDRDGETYGHITIDISGGTIGNEVGNVESGNVFGASMGRLTLLNGTTNPIWPKMAQVKNTTVTVSGGTIKRTVFGGGELGTVRDNATVNITGGTIGRDVYGAGYGSDDFTTKTMITVKEPKEGVTNPSSASDYNDVSYVFTPMIFAGSVGQNTYVNVSGGHVKKSVYGGGEMASAGIIDCRVKKDNSATNPIYTDGTDKYVYISNHKHSNQDNDFVLSWPYHFENVPGYFGATHVEVTGGRIGLKGGETNPFGDLDNGDVIGGSKGIAGDFNDYVFCANVGSTEVTINYPNTADPASYDSNGSGVDCITGAVYGGAENGHVMGDTKVTLKKGLIGHSVYGGGSGKGKFSTKLLKIGAPANSTKESDYYTREIYSITAGKVFGNTEIIMEDGYVVRNVYGGGNMGSVGKGNYAGGPDDYSTAGYGEKVKDYNLWDKSNPFGEAFLNSGKSKVTILGGTVGYINPANPSESVYGGLPYGNVFGGCRGEAAPNIRETPRYLYSPEFFVGYVNETDVTIGTVGQAGPKISGSVYGGGMDGHVRRDTKVTINSGEIGSVNGGLDNGNVYGAGSGIGKYKYDFDYDGKYTSTVKYHDKDTKEEDYSTSAGSVTRFTTVDINGGTIHRTVYGGGSLSSVGAPKIGQDYDPYHPEDSEHSGEAGKLSLNKVTISGGQIGDAEGIAADYGGDVIGGSRGESAFENSLMSPSSFASSVWTDVTIKDDANVLGNVFGGGEAGMVKYDTDVKMQGGTVGNDLYGGGDMADVGGNTTVTLTGGTVNHDVFGGARGRLPQGDDPGAEANVGGDVLVTLNGTQTTDAESGTVSFNDNCVVNGSIFGCNNVNGTPMGHSTVHIFKTAPSTNGTDYDLVAVYGGGKQSDYVPADTDEKQSTEVIIEGCDLTSIENVYGGGYGAATPGTNVLIKGTKIIDNVYGGGFGADDPEKSYINPGANVGYHTDGVRYESGDGRAVVQLMAGNVHHVYGGSNTKGDIFAGSFVTNVANDGGPGCCKELVVEEIYGGGKSADMYGGAEIVLGCMPDDWIGAIYAGAENADVGNDISLTLTSGKFGRVFGGNNMGGKIDGSIEVNIEENPDCDTPLVIGELYGGGNQASYETPARYFTQNYPNYQSPRVNVRAFTSIGNIYGGGYGANATVTGNPMVNINEVEGGKEFEQMTKTLDDGTEVILYARPANGKMGVIGTVFGGGNAAKVIGNTTVNVGTTAEEQMVSLQTTDDEGNVVIVKKPVVGADIRGNVYGGGNAAEVTGKTNVIIGQDGTTVTPTPSTSPVEP